MSETLFSACLAESKQESLCPERTLEKAEVSDVGPHPHCPETAHAGYLPDRHRP